MAVDDVDWWQLLDQLLTEHEPTAEGERAAVLEFGLIYRRFVKESST